jgi:hypothetical protein
MVDNLGIETQMLSLDEIVRYHEDTVSSLKLYFNEISAYSAKRFVDYTPTMRAEELRNRIEETSLRSILVILASLEARFRVDFESRCQNRYKDKLSRAFRTIHKKRQDRVSLEEDIFSAWKTYRNDSKQLVGNLKSAFKLRHWLAHGRYWQPKLGRTFDYETIYDLAAAVNEEFFGDRPVNP